MQKKLSANNTIFKINVDFENSKADYINSKESTQGIKPLYKSKSFDT